MTRAQTHMHACIRANLHPQYAFIHKHTHTRTHTHTHTHLHTAVCTTRNKTKNSPSLYQQASPIRPRKQANMPRASRHMNTQTQTHTHTHTHKHTIVVMFQKVLNLEKRSRQSEHLTPPSHQACSHTPGLPPGDLHQKHSKQTR